MKVASMGDISAEPSMEEILSSIKRIIAEEGEGARPPARRQPQRPAPMTQPIHDASPARDAVDEVLELREPIPAPVAAAPPPPAPPRAAEPIVSHQAAAASRGALDALSRAVVRPEGAPAAAPVADNALEAVVRDMLRPMLREWLDSKLPDMVEAMVAREIERITGQR